MLWGYPETLPIGIKDNIYDMAHAKWYVASITGSFQGTVSLADFVLGTSDDVTFAEHRFNEKHITTVKMARKDITINISEVRGKFRSKRKLSRLALAFG
jgi:hypothetical protein